MTDVDDGGPRPLRPLISMMEPQLETLLDLAGSKFALVTLASQRARQINQYYGGLGGETGTAIPPQVASTAHKALSVALEEISAGKITGVATSRPDDADPQD
jgi:DNA-directed RNA polymerase subunit omega